MQGTVALLLLTAFFPSLRTLAAPMPSREQILADMLLANTYFTNKWPVAGCSSCLPGGRASYIWTRGTYFEGELALYRMTGYTGLYDYAVAWGTFHNWNLWNGELSTHPDSQCSPQSYIELYQFDPTQTNRLKYALTNVNYWVGTTNINRLTYVDAIHMSLPLFAKAAVVTGNTNYTERMYAYFDYIKSVRGASNGIYNKTDHLWWRDVNFLSNYTASDGTKQKCYWSRGNGWAFMALARILDVLSTNDTHYGEYLQTFQEMAAALRPIQRPDGFWNVNLGYTNDFPGPETSGTAMFTYGLAWGIHHGHLNISDYLPTVVAGWNALATGALHHNDGTNSGFLGYVQKTGSKPADGQPVTYTSVPDFEDYALGAFLLTGSEVYALNALPVITNQPVGDTINAGQNIAFNVAATGNPLPAYQWRRNGTNVVDGGNIAGATTPSLVLTNAQISDAGTYVVIVTNLAGSAVSSNAVLDVRWTFEAFRHQYFTNAELDDVAISGPEADPDSDGLNNVNEYALGFDPRQLDATGASITPDISGGYLKVTFIRRNDVGDLAYIPEVSEDLLTWNSGPSYTEEVTSVPLDAQRDRVTVRDLAPVFENANRFLRVRFHLE